jgi:small subunit ribosomal protein S5
MNALSSLQDVRVVAKKRGKTPKTLFEIWKWQKNN